MIKIIRYSNTTGLNELVSFLDQRRDSNYAEIDLVKKIINDIKKNKLKALKKYEKKYSKNNEIKLSRKKINGSIKQLDQKVRRFIFWRKQKRRS